MEINKKGWTSDNNETKKMVRNAYAKIASKNQDGCGCCSTSQVSPDSHAFGIGYTGEELAQIPDGANLGLSCGNPTTVAELKKGEVVLDLGAGAGFDVFIAASKVGPSGKVIGVDMTEEMVSKASENANKAEAKNVEFRLGEIEKLPVNDSTIDVVISNCVINLSPDKESVFKEIYRVLKPGGRVSISDIALTKPLPKRILNNKDAYTGCISGAILVDDYRELIHRSGIKNTKITKKGPSGCVSKEDQDISEQVISIIVEGYKL